jgi:hypothetical protein
MAHDTNAQGSGGYEKRDVNVRNLVLITIGCVIAVVASMVWVKSYFTQVTEETVYQMVLQPGSLTLQELRAREDEALNKYRIIDLGKGVYQIPIDSAMAILAREATRGPAGN